MSKLEIKILHPGDADWGRYADLINDYVEQTAAARIYHLPGCSELIQNEFRHRCFYFVALEDSRITGLLPVIQQKSRLFGNHMISMPFFNYGGVVASNPEAELSLLQHAIAMMNKNGASDLELRETTARTGFKSLDHKVAMILELPAEARLLEMLGTKIRAQIKRPLQQNAVHICGKEELLDDFYNVFSRNMRDLGTPVYQKSFFSAMIKRFRQGVWLHIIKINNIPVGAAFVLGYKETAEIPWASTIREYNKYGVNMLMYWEVIKKAIKDGYKYFDFGRSSKDSGTYKFKKQWGALPVQLYWNYTLAPGAVLPMNNPANAKYALAIKIWQKLPLAITEWLGPKLARNLP